MTYLSGDMVFVRQSDSIVDVSIQRGKSPLESSTCSSQSLRCFLMSCFKVEKSIVKRLLSTCCVLDDTRCENKLSQSANQTCPIDADAVPSPRRMLSCLFISTRGTGKRKLLSTPLDNAYVSVITNVFLQTFRIRLELQHSGYYRTNVVMCAC